MRRPQAYFHWLAVGVLALAGGCSPYKDPPDIIHGDNYSAYTRPEHRGFPTDVKVLTVEKAIDLALSNNPDFISSRYSMVAAYAALYQAISAYFPTLTANFSAQQQQWTPMSQGGNGIHSQWRPTYAGSLQAQWVVFDGFMRDMNMLSARASALQSEALNRNARRTLIRAVILAYNQILLSNAEIDIAKADETFERQMVEYTQLKYDAGAAALSDLLNFKILVNSAQNNIVTATYNYDAYRFALAALMGLTTGEIPENVQFSEINEAETEQYSLGIDCYLDMAIAQRPDLESYRYALSAARYNLLSSYGAFLPTAGVYGNYGYSRSDTTETSYPNGAASPRGSDLLYNYGFQTQWLLFDGGERIAASRAAHAQLDYQRQQLAGIWITVVNEVRQAYDKLRVSVANAKILSETLKMTIKQRDLVREEYNAGNTSITRLNEVQKDVVDAQLNFAKALVEIQNAKAQLDAASGAL